MKRTYKKSVLALIMLICVVMAVTPVMGKTILNKEQRMAYYRVGKIWKSYAGIFG